MVRIIRSWQTEANRNCSSYLVVDVLCVAFDDDSKWPAKQERAKAPINVRAREPWIPEDGHEGNRTEIAA